MSARRPPHGSTMRHAMVVLRDASFTAVSEALADKPEPRQPDRLADALDILRAWFRTLPAERNQPPMTFPEYVRLLHDALHRRDEPISDAGMVGRGITASRAAEGRCRDE